MAERKKTRKSVRESVRRYQAKFDIITIRTPKGTKQLIQSRTGLSCSEYINRLIADDIQGYIPADNRTIDVDTTSSVPDCFL